MEHFQDCVSICCMEDIVATGALFTWSNKQAPRERVYSRLDRAMGNLEWFEQFGDSVAHFHPEGLFDHCPCTGTKMFGIVKRLKALKPILKALNRECFSDIENNTNIASLALENIQKALIDSPSDADLLQQELDLAHDLKELITARDSFLMQKAKVQWSLDGDLNTSYFHHSIKKRVMMNKVFQIEDKDGRLCTNGTAIQSAFLDYYQELLGSHKSTDVVNSTMVRNGVCCTESHWALLNRPVTADEVKKSLFSIPSNKSPGPDGLLTQINSTVITLIPKTGRPTSVKHYRPISCCNVIYKVISKLLCSRLALILPDLICKTQGAFVKGRSILENILICQDLIRQYNRGKASPRCLFKLDLQKAYDSIEWAFVDQMLEALLFPEKFRRMIMTCISTPTYTLNLNGAQFGFFDGRRGLRQGDPISPLIFCICMEYLSRLMEFATRKWYFRYHPMCKSLRLTHLLFADDLLMFSKGDVQSIMLILRVLATFSGSSGLKVNAAKSEVVFNGVSEVLKQDIAQVSGFQEGTLPFKYLGIPIQPGRLTKADCNVLLEKIVSRIRGIGARKLSYAGRLVLINSIITGHLWWHGIMFVKVKKEGGLGIKDAGVWNIASVGKLVNWIYTKADRLWVLWIDHVYMKGADWTDYHPPPDSNWNWRNICRVKDLLVGGYQDSCWTGSTGTYTISAGYHWLQEPHPPVLWHQDVWDPWVLPKHAFVGWLIYRAALNTRSKMFKLGLSVTASCVLCEMREETHDHLFWECAYSSQVLAGLEHWFQLKLTTPSSSMSKLQRRICRVVKMAAWYTLWMQRNNARLELTLCRPEKLVQQIQNLVHGRIVGKLNDFVMPRDCNWLSKINIRCLYCT
ncbi:uncharacterized protein LOC141639314 [Silene latifolia]|uniref:uncharacterized protein LOC141639314 n=1 Tax=Silene latifolia TaxID=37657 RepID=UPI003D76B93E